MKRPIKSIGRALAILAICQVFLSTLVTPAHGFIVGITDVQALIKKADLIVTATADPTFQDNWRKELATSKTRGTGGSDYEIPQKLQIKTILKGHVERPSGSSSATTVTFTYDAESTVPFSQFDDQTGVYFLCKSKDGHYVPADQQHIGIPLIPGSDIKTGPDLLKSIAAQEVTILSTSEKDILKGGKNRIVGQSYDASGKALAITQVDDLRTMADDALIFMPTSIVVPLLKSNLGSKDQHCRLCLMACLCHFKDYQGIEEYEEIMCSSPDNLHLQVNKLANRLTYLTGERYVPMLSALLSSRNPCVRQAAAYSLRETATASTVKPLATKGIFDACQYVRWYSMAGLAEVLHIPAQYPKFNSRPLIDGLVQSITPEEQPYIEFWRAYAAGKFPDFK